MSSCFLYEVHFLDPTLMYPLFDMEIFGFGVAFGRIRTFKAGRFNTYLLCLDASSFLI